MDSVELKREIIKLENRVKQLKGDPDIVAQIIQKTQELKYIADRLYVKEFCGD